MALTVVGIGIMPTTPALAAPVYEIDGRWAEELPEAVATGDVLTAEWRVNVNDDAAAPSNDPVDDITVTLTVENGRFAELPEVCLVDGVTTASSISEDGSTLVCNIGTQDQGTAHVIQAPVIVEGATGSQLSMTGEVDGITDELPPAEIVNPFGMDIRWSEATPRTAIHDPVGGTYTIDLDLQWTLSKILGSDAGPDSVSYDLTIGSDQADSIELADLGCTPFDTGGAGGHPWSGGDHAAESTVAPVGSCVIEQTGAGTFRLTLSGIDYEPTTPATLDSFGNPLPTDEIALHSGSIWVQVTTTRAGSISLESSAPTYTSVNGDTATDDAADNTVSKTFHLPGGYATTWARAHTNSGGTPHDVSYQVTAGTELRQNLVTGYVSQDRADDLPIGMCAPLDTRYVTFSDMALDTAVPGATIEYYVGGGPRLDPNSESYDPAAFQGCGLPANWVTTIPDDPSQVRAVRVTLTQGQAEAADWDAPNAGWGVLVDVHDDVEPGQDIWSFMYVQDPDGSWRTGTGCLERTPGLRYPCTNGLNDLVRIISAEPYIEKSSDRATVTIGEPSSFSLNYSANVSGEESSTVDGFTIVDTLPAGMTYVAGSATPEPELSTDGQGRQVLTWTLDGVETNILHALTYQAVADDSVEPGATLENTVTATLAGVSSEPATAQVTTSTTGYTAIGKVADRPYVPNSEGDGVGEGSWTVTLRSYDPLPQAFTDTIDILPFNGDERGTSFAGDYALTAVEAEGATVYYTTADPTTLTDDPADPSHGAAGDPTGSTVGWTTEFTPEATAVRVIGPELAPRATQQFRVVFTTDGAAGGDVLVNRAQGRAGHTELVMRTSAPITVANDYAASLKKYVQDSAGEWHDANDATDYPSFRSGDTVRYRVVVTNDGGGTLHDIEVNDDLQPELGAFVIDELAPGEDAVHEYEIVIEEGGADLVINTACATAAVPADAEAAPEINCDPAGFEVVGEPTHTKELLSAEAIGDGRWEVVFGLDVTSTSTYPTSYSLADTLQFTEEATITSAEVTTSPEGVTLAEPVWDGQGSTLIAADVPLAGTDDAGYAPHHYEVTVIAEVPLQLVGAGADPDATECADTELYVAFNNTSELTMSDGRTEEGQDCAEVPSIGLTKSVTGEPTENGDGTWTAMYEITATNDGAAAGTYSVTDTMSPQGGLTVESAEIVTAPEGVTTSPDWTGLGTEESSPENLIAADVTLEGGAVHTYQVEVTVSLEGADGIPAVGLCTEDGATGADGLLNVAELEHNDLRDADSECITVTQIVVDKQIAMEPTENGDGTWTVEYEILAENVGDISGEYDLYDQLRFGDGIEITAAAATGPDGVTVQDGWTGLGEEHAASENLVAQGIALEAGASHTYLVTITVALDESVITSEDLVCDSGGTGGLANGVLLDHNGRQVTDEVCPSVPLVDIEKSIAEGPVAGGDGSWTITYDLVASNTGAATGTYDLTDRLQFAEGIVIESADVTGLPEGVTAPEGWTGQGTEGAEENEVATGISLEADGTHTYQVQVVVSLDQETATATTLTCDTGPDSGLFNTVTLTHNGEQRTDDACAELPLVDISKSLDGGVVPVDGQPGLYDATYQISVSNRGPGASVYTLEDSWTEGSGVTVEGVQDVATDAADPVGLNPGFGTEGDTLIVAEQPIAGAAAGAPVVHTYTVVVRYALDLTEVGASAAETCSAGVDGSLHNEATVTWNGVVDRDDECLQSGRPTLDKELTSAQPIGDGQWEVVYDLTVGNTGNEVTRYDLDDEFLFAPVLTVGTVGVTGPEGIGTDAAFDGDEHQRIATDVEILGLDDEGYTPHVYRITVIVGVPLHFAPAEADGTGSPACTEPSGDNLLEQGLNNVATLTDETGGQITDTDCGELPSIDITKSIVGEPTVDGDGIWTIEYEIVALNDGAEAGDYQLTDRLRYGIGIDVVGAEVTDAPEGVETLATWTGQGEAGADENIVASAVPLAAGTEHSYRVIVTATVDGETDGSTAFTCPEPGQDGHGGFANTAGIVHNDLTDEAEACATPEEPGEPNDPPVPNDPEDPVVPNDPVAAEDGPGGALARTGVNASTILLSALGLLAAGGGAVLLTRRRSTQGLESEDLG